MGLKSLENKVLQIEGRQARKAVLGKKKSSEGFAFTTATLETGVEERMENPGLNPREAQRGKQGHQETGFLLPLLQVSPVAVPGKPVRRVTTQGHELELTLCLI